MTSRKSVVVVTESRYHSPVCIGSVLTSRRSRRISAWRSTRWHAHTARWRVRHTSRRRSCIPWWRERKRRHPLRWATAHVWWREGRHVGRHSAGTWGHALRWEGWHSVWWHWGTSAAHELRWHSTHRRHSWWWESRHTHGWHSHGRHSGHWSSREATSQVLLEQGVRLAFCVVRVGDTVDDLLCLVARYLLVVGLDVAEVVATVVMGLAHAHTIVREVDIAIVTEELGHRVRIIRLVAEMGNSS